MASVQADEETYSLEETILIRKKQICSTGECFQANDSQGSFLRGLQDDYLRSKPHVEGEHFL